MESIKGVRAYSALKQKDTIQSEGGRGRRAGQNKRSSFLFNPKTKILPFMGPDDQTPREPASQEQRYNNVLQLFHQHCESEATTVSLLICRTLSNESPVPWKDQPPPLNVTNALKRERDQKSRGTKEPEFNKRRLSGILKSQTRQGQGPKGNRTWVKKTCVTATARLIP